MSSINGNSTLLRAVQGTGTGENKHKARKNRSGIVPCEICVRSGQECIIDAEGDQRRKLNLKRKLDSLENDRELLIRLLDNIRKGRESHVAELLRTIRSSSELEDIKSFLDIHAPQTATELTSRRPSERMTGTERCHSSHTIAPKELTARQIVLMTPNAVPAKPWTTVTDDNNLVSHLISCWLTWHHLWFHYIDPATLINAMRTEDLQSPLCSPFLVNAILAHASFLSDDPAACAIDGDWRTKGDHFYNEAKFLLDQEEGRVSIPTVQGLAIMFECACAKGKDRAGWLYSIQAADGMRTIRKQQARLVLDTGLSTEHLKLLMQRMELSHSSLLVFSALVFQLPPQVAEMPDYRMPTPCGVREENSPTNASGTFTNRAHEDCILNTLVQLGEIGRDVASFIGREDRDWTHSDLSAAAEKWHARLGRCWETRSKCIDRKKNPMPGILTLYMYYHAIIITMYAFLTAVVPGAEDWDLQQTERARQICLLSAHQITQLTDTQQLHWGLDSGPFANAHFINISLYILMEDLRNPASHVAFMKLCQAHIQFAKRWPLHRGTVRMVQLTAQRMKDPLLPDVIAHFREFEERYWKADNNRQFSSRYPNFDIAIRRGVEDLELDAFLEKWVNLDS